MPSKAKTVAAYLKEVPADRRKDIEAMRKVIQKNIDKPFEEGMQYGGIGYYLPHSVYPNGYHCDPKQPLPFAGIINQKGHIGLYLFCIYTDPETLEWFVDAWKKTGKRLDMGKSCVRVKKLEDVPLDVLGQLFKRIRAKAFVAAYEGSLGDRAPTKRAPAKKAAAKKATKKTTKKAAAKKSPAKKKAAKKTTAKKKTVAKKKVTKKATRKTR